VKIERIEVRELHLPLVAPFETSFGRTVEKEFLLISVFADGVAGHGECVTDADPYYLPETNGTVWHVLRDFLVPLALRLDIGHPRDVLPALARVRGHEMAKGALEMAVWHLWASREQAPLWRVVLGDRPVTKTAIPAGVSIGLQDGVPALLDRVQDELAAGYRRIKIKIKPGKDRALVRAVRERFGPVPLMVDANSAYTLDDVPLFQALDGEDLMMVEQPLAWDDIVDHATLQRAIRTPVCLDESIHSVDDVRRALDLGSCRIVNVKPGRVGGIASTIALQDLCLSRGVPVWCGGMLESGIGRLANVHIQALPGFTLPGDTSASARYFREDLVDPPVAVASDGTIPLPQGPGLGHEIVWGRVEKATRTRETWVA
jgi:O-succinylbenzoate synthase